MPLGPDSYSCALRPGLTAANRRLSTPLSSKTANPHVSVCVEAQELTNHSTIQESAAGVGVCQVSELEFLAAELVEDQLGILAKELR